MSVFSVLETQFRHVLPVIMQTDVPACLGFHYLSIFRSINLFFVCYQFFKQQLIICDCSYERDDL